MIGRLFWACVGGVAYTYAGYPLLVSLLARLRPRPAALAPAEPSVTLLIAAYNEQAVIGAKLANSLALEYPRAKLQIVVAADGSDDNTPAIVGGFAEQGVELSYSPPRRGKMAAINRALALAHGEIVVFSDANNSYAPDALRQLVAPFADASIGAVSGAKVIARGDGALGDSEGLYWRYEAFIKKQETRLGCCTGVAGEIFAIRRELYEPPPDSIINDDFWIAARLIRRGHRVVYAGAARSTEHVSATAGDEAARRSRIVAGRFQAIANAHKLLPPRRPLVAWQIVSHKFLRPLVPLAMLGALVCNLLAVARPARAGQRGIARLAPPTNWIMLLLQAAFYAAALLGGRIAPRGRAGKLLYVATFLVNSNAAALVGLVRFVSGRQTTLWRRAERRPMALPEASEPIAKPAGDAEALLAGAVPAGGDEHA